MSPSLQGLPDPSKPIRWTKRLKLDVISAVKGGRLSLQDAEKIYNISQQELESWLVLWLQFGAQGLRATRLQEYRQG